METMLVIVLVGAISTSILVTLIVILYSKFRIVKTLPKPLTNPEEWRGSIISSFEHKGYYYKLPTLISKWIYVVNGKWYVILRLTRAESMLDKTYNTLKKG